MSSRALRRLEKAQALKSPDHESSDSEPEFQSKANAFALLNEDQSEPEEDDEEETKVVHTESKPLKKKKKGKGKLKKSTAADEIDDAELDKLLEEVRKRDQTETPPAVEAAEGEEDPEALYDEQDPPVLYTDSNYLYFTTSRLKQSLPFLSIGAAKNLDPDTELKNLFGNLSLDVIEDANTSTSLAVPPDVLAQFKKLARLTRGWGGRDHRSVPGTSRKLLLTRIKDDWLPTPKNPLTMEEFTNEEVVRLLSYKEDAGEHELLERKAVNEGALGVRYFAFNKIPSVPDRVANSRFYASVVMTSDPESLIQLIQQNPYHAETLLQLAMVVLRQGNDKSTSNSLIDRCLFVFDRSFNKRFHEMLLSGKSELIRLPYESFMNRQFYLCLFRIITGLSERSTFYTALSYCKLLLSLSPAEDPLGVRYFIDHYAILAEEYQYLVDLVNSPLVQTYALWYTPGLAFSEVLALLHLDQKDNAKRALAQAFQVHPYCAFQLLAAVGLATAPPVKLSSIQKDEYSVLASETYLVRAPALWKEQGHRTFLHDELMALFGQKQEKTSWISKWFGTPKKEGKDIPVNLVRFAILSGETKVLAKVPEKIFERDDVSEYDVLPPKDTSSGYDVFTGVSEQSVTDSLFDYLDHNIISAIVQNRTGAAFDEMLELDAVEAENVIDADQ